MSKIVVSQPYYFPWIGLFEQVRLSDIFVHYDDVQFIRRHFMDRVQIPCGGRTKWITVPKVKTPQSTMINRVRIDYSSDWKNSHLDFLMQVYRKAPYRNEMTDIVKMVFSREARYLSDLTIESIMAVLAYYNLMEGRRFLRSSEMSIGGEGTERLLKIVESLGGTSYITGMGALKYFDFEMFASKDIDVEFISYNNTPYTQLEEEFNPYVSILDLIANHGREGIEYISSGSIDWKTFIKSDTARRYLEKNN